MKPLEVKSGGKEQGTRFVGGDLGWLYTLAVTSGLLCYFIVIVVILLMVSGRINF